MKIQFCTLMDDNFYPGYRVFFLSLLKHNPNFAYSFLILDGGLSPSVIKDMKSIYPHIQIVSINKNAYTLKKGNTANRLMSTYYKLDTFLLSAMSSDTDRLIFMDMDILIKGSLQELISFDMKGYPFAACRMYKFKKDRVIKNINSGVFILDNKQIQLEDYEKMVQMAKQGFDLPDQDIINAYFVNTKKCAYIPKKFNVEKRMITSKKYADIYNNTICLHYVNTKPWEKKTKSEEIFKKAYDEWRIYDS